MGQEAIKNESGSLWGGEQDYGRAMETTVEDTWDMRPIQSHNPSFYSLILQPTCTRIRPSAGKD